MEKGGEPQISRFVEGIQKSPRNLLSGERTNPPQVWSARVAGRLV